MLWLDLFLLFFLEITDSNSCRLQIRNSLLKHLFLLFQTVEKIMIPFDTDRRLTSSGSVITCSLTLELTRPSCVQVGLVVRKLNASSDRSLVYSLLPMPPTDASEPACSLQAAASSAGKAKPKGGRKGGAAASSDALPLLQFDVNWV